MDTKRNRVLDFIKGDLWIVLLDAVAVNAAYFIALMIRLSLAFNFRKEVLFYRDDFLMFAPWYTFVCLFVFYMFNLYGGMWRYAGINDMNRIVLANLTTCIIQITVTFLIGARMPITYYILGALFQFLAISAIRFAYRIAVVERRKLSEKHADALIIGGGEEAHSVYKILDSGMTYRPICFVDRKSTGRTRDGLPVYKTIEEALELRIPDCVFIADLRLNGEEKKRIRETCTRRNVKVRDYTTFLSYTGENDAFFGMQNVIRGPQNGERSIPFSPPDISDAEIGEVVDTLRSGWITTGPRTKLLERRLAAYIETGKTDIDTEKEPEHWNQRVVCLNSATAAEELNLRIWGIRPGDEVIVPAYTYTASASAAIHCGAKVVFVDIQKDGDPITHMPEMDYDALEAAITENTKAIITVDLGGIACDYDRIFEIVERKRSLFKPLNDSSDPLSVLSSRIQRSIGRIAVVADCAHSLGASRKFGGEKKYCGEIADFSSFSFHAVKNLTTAEGGASTWRPLEGVSNAEIYRMYQLLSLHGQSKDALAKTKVGAWEYDIIGPWYKCNMTDIVAALGLRQLDRYPDLLRRRAEIVRKYDALCDELGLEHLVHHTDSQDSSRHLYLVRVPGISADRRNRIIDRMSAQGVAINVHYKPLPMMTAYRELGWDIADFPNAYNYFENLFTLPLHTLLEDEDVAYVCETLRKAIKESV